MNDLYRLVNDTNDAGFDCCTRQSIWQRLLQADQLALSTEGQLITNRLVKIVTAALTKSYRQPFRHWLEGIWLALGGPASY